MEQKKCGRSGWWSEPGMGLALGVSIGSAFGIIFDKLAIGIALGVALGASFDRLRMKKAKKENKPEK